MTVSASTQDCCSCCDPRIVTMVAQLSDHAELYRRFYSTEAPRAFERGMREHQAIVDELPPNSWSRETFEVYYCRKRRIRMTQVQKTCTAELKREAVRLAQTRGDAYDVARRWR